MWKANKLGKASIQGGGENGLYTAKIIYDERSVSTLIANIDIEIAKIDAELTSVINPAIAKAEEIEEQKQAEVEELLSAYGEAILEATVDDPQSEDTLWPNFNMGEGFQIEYDEAVVRSVFGDFADSFRGGVTRRSFDGKLVII